MWNPRYLHPKVCNVGYLIANDVVCVRLWIGLLQSVRSHWDCDRKRGLFVVYTWQVVVLSSLSQCIHSVNVLVNSQLCALSLVLANVITISVITLNFEPNYLVCIWFFQHWTIGYDITVVCAQLLAIFYYGDITRFG